jgi:aspartate ammonia-lyase
VQAGSSIMPGTVVPELAEAAHQVAFDADRPALRVGVTTRGGSRQALLREAR